MIISFIEAQRCSVDLSTTITQQLLKEGPISAAGSLHHCPTTESAVTISYVFSGVKQKNEEKERDTHMFKRECGLLHMVRK